MYIWVWVASQPHPSCHRHAPGFLARFFQAPGLHQPGLRTTWLLALLHPNPGGHASGAGRCCREARWMGVTTQHTEVRCTGSSQQSHKSTTQVSQINTQEHSAAAAPLSPAAPRHDTGPAARLNCWLSARSYKFLPAPACSSVIGRAIHACWRDACWWS